MYGRYRQAKNKEWFRREHEGDIILHEAALASLKAVQAGRGGKLPNPQVLRADYEKLKGEKDQLYKEYGELKKQVRQLDTLKANVDKILGVPGRGKRSAVEL